LFPGTLPTQACSQGPGTSLARFPVSSWRAAPAAHWITAIGTQRTARWYITTADRDRPGHFIQLVEFPNHAAAMTNSERARDGHAQRPALEPVWASSLLVKATGHFRHLRCEHLYAL